MAAMKAALMDRLTVALTVEQKAGEKDVLLVVAKVDAWVASMVVSWDD